VRPRQEGAASAREVIRAAPAERPRTVRAGPTRLALGGQRRARTLLEASAGRPAFAGVAARCAAGAGRAASRTSAAGAGRTALRTAAARTRAGAAITVRARSRSAARRRAERERRRQAPHREPESPRHRAHSCAIADASPTVRIRVSDVT
jgi:hypothetical protein